MQSLTREQVRDVDRQAIEEYGIPGVVLMENAGRAAAELLVSLGVEGKVVICAGRGNNGGDGYVIARHLLLHRVTSEILLFCDPERITGDARVNFDIVQRGGMQIQLAPDEDGLNAARAVIESADWIVDALLGTGLSGEVRGIYRSAIEAINSAPATVLAVDLPSGMDCNTGKPLGVCVKADHTVTFVARKIGFDQPDAQQWTGKVSVAGIGFPWSDAR